MISLEDIAARVDQLESYNAITELALQLDPHKLGFTIKVMAELTISKHDERNLAEFAHEVQMHDDIVACFSMSGASEYLLRIVAYNFADYQAFLKRVLFHLPGVASVNSRFALKALKIHSEPADLIETPKHCLPNAGLLQATKAAINIDMDKFMTVPCSLH